MYYDEKAKGISYALAAYTLWGLLPIYWKLLNSVLPLELLSHRIVWAFVFTTLVVIVSKQWAQLKEALQDKKQALYILAASIIIAFNWGLYIWAVNSNRIVEASLGYYINPLIVVLLGVFVFKEKLDHWTGIALLIATIGVLIKALQYGYFPWVSLSLAFSFALYGMIKKKITASSIVGLTLETAMLLPLAAAYISFRHVGGVGAFQMGRLSVTLLLMAAGIVTAIPLLLFSSAAKRLPMSLIGFTQYISPTISLLIGVLIYHERFTFVDLIAFCIIWLALGLFTFSQVTMHKRTKLLEQVG